MSKETVQELGVGKDILSYCGKCKLALAHVIVTMIDSDTVGKCECNTCGATHRYRDPTSVDPKKKARPGHSKKEHATVEELWKEALSKSEGAASKGYSMKEKFSEGDVIDHPTFGKGVVEKVVDHNKIQTLFQHDLKLLIHDRS